MWLLVLLGLLVFLGRVGIRNIFKSKKPRFAQPTWLGALFLLAPVLGTFGTIFPQAVGNVTPMVLAYSVLFALINGVGEELLWRGTFVSVFPESWGWGVVYPLIGFGLWYFSPLVVTAGQAPVLLVTIGPIILGVMWGWIAKQTYSIRWVVCAVGEPDRLSRENIQVIRQPPRSPGRPDEERQRNAIMGSFILNRY